MKKLLVIFLMLIGLTTSAKEQEIYVLPLFMNDSFNTNSYSFESTSEIIAGDIIHNFQLGTQVNSTKLAIVKATHANDTMLRQIADRYRKTGLIDFEKITTVSLKNTADSTLLIASFVQDINGQRLDLWDVMKFSSDFSLDTPYNLTTKVMLIDNKEGILLWQKTYYLPLTAKNKPFTAQNYSKAVEQYEKIRSYSKNIIAKDVEQNLYLRLNHKTINYAQNVQQQTGNTEGIGLKYYKKGGVPTTKITQPEETFEQQLLKEDSFSL